MATAAVFDNDDLRRRILCFVYPSMCFVGDIFCVPKGPRACPQSAFRIARIRKNATFGVVVSSHRSGLPLQQRHQTTTFFYPDDGDTLRIICSVGH